CAKAPNYYGTWFAYW
nr:immunoglobulin heavy chain junction region [Mus musculus]MBK4195220.1 immunoglobulin heavy chain junction region [Mus musculus]